MLNQLGKIMDISQSLENKDLEIENLDIKILEKSDGVIISITSPDKDGAKMAQSLGEIMASLPEMLEQQSQGKLKVTLKRGKSQ